MRSRLEPRARSTLSETAGPVLQSTYCAVTQQGKPKHSFERRDHLGDEIVEIDPFVGLNVNAVTRENLIICRRHPAGGYCSPVDRQHLECKVPAGDGRAIQIFLDDTSDNPSMFAMASSTVSLPVHGRRTTRSPRPPPSVIT